MSYLALYRKFRPTSFNEVIGQDAIVKTLTNQIISNKIGHAYLFCGARGTGKTTLAKIFAKAVNCDNFENGSVCGKCVACQSLNDLSNIDIVEMDAASNNKVENVREIRESVQYPPVNVRYKVYIIDEVHMLTTEAFNALLKTLEEPPKHAIFVLATTEPHKLPATILSRCMRFDFRLVSTGEIALLIKNVYDKIGKKYEEDAINLIARAGEGSVRDALSVADLCLSISQDVLTYKDVSLVLGATDITKTNALITNILKGDIGGVLTVVDELYSLGKNLTILLKDCVNFLRDLMIAKTCKNPQSILNLPNDTLELLKSTCVLANENRILRVIEILSSTENTLKYSTQQRAVLESALLKATMPETDLDINALMARIKSLEDELNNLKNNGIKVVSSNVEPKPTKVEEKEKIAKEKAEIIEDIDIPPILLEEPSIPNEDLSSNIIEEAPPTIKENKTPIVNANGKKLWGSIVRKLRNMPEKTILWVACQELTADLIDNTLFINAQSDIEKQLLYKDGNLDLLNELVKNFGDYDVKVKDEKTKNNQNLEEDVKKFFDGTIKVLD